MLSFKTLDSCQFLISSLVFVRIFGLIENFTSINIKFWMNRFLFQSQEFFQRQRTENFSKLLSF